MGEQLRSTKVFCFLFLFLVREITANLFADGRGPVENTIIWMGF